MSAADVMNAISMFFEAGKRGDFAAMRRMFVDSGFSGFGDVPPFGVRDAETMVVLEEMRLASLSDYNYDIRDAKTNVFGDLAIVTFMLNQRGILVDNKTFSGKTISVDSRATFVLTRADPWRIVHMHISRADTS